MKNILLIIVTFACFSLSNCSDSNSDNKISADNPEQMADLAFEIATTGKDQEKLTKIFNKYNYPLMSGTETFIAAYEEMRSDTEKYQVFSEKLKQSLADTVISKKDSAINKP